ncbi:Ion-translocating oxidoreductase complex subunit B [Bienertia sinuspersici]
MQGGVINERCYGCGRCLPVSPYDNIKAITYLRDAITTAQLVRRNDVDAIEIHTNGREVLAFVVRLAAAEDRPPGNVEDGILSGKMSGSHNSLIGGIAYGGYARKIVGRILRAMQSQHGLACVEDHPTYLSAAVREALALVGSVKCYVELRINRD